MERRRTLNIAYVHFGNQSGVTPGLARALAARGHLVVLVRAVGPLELRDERGRPRMSLLVFAQLAAALARFGRRALIHRWNTPFAFDAHTRHAGDQLGALAASPDVVLQNGALFAPGWPPRQPYVLLLDHTHALSLAAPDYGPGWLARERALYRGAAALATFSRCVARSLKDDYEIEPARVRVVGAGANVFPAEARRADDGRTILFVGRDFARKGGPVLLRAFERLRRRRPKARLLVAGPRKLSGLPEGATLLGPVPMEHLPDVMARSTVFALPTLREPFGLAYLDAMACAVPCVGTNVEAVPEVILHGQTGLLVPPDDDVALAAALERLLDDPAEARRMGESGRRRVEQRFRWSQVAARLESILWEVVAGITPARVPGGSIGRSDGLRERGFPAE